MPKTPLLKPTPKGTVTRIRDLRADPNNPRTITAKALRGLGYSQEEFGDLSGIVYNIDLKMLVSGHQRVEALKADHGNDLPIQLDPKNPDRGFIVTPKGEKFGIRIVRWDKDKHRAAGVAANATTIQGTFTDALAPQLESILGSNPGLHKALDLSVLQPKPKKEKKEVKFLAEDKASFFRLEVNCADEAQQKALFDELTERGHKCKVLIF